ncbi:RNA polymerase sigma factor [Paenibacillus wenxiniae]|uniref:RNA polymerase sigma factor n=1 Tax=Paenibacillus wenxiniae TaxID=1636843 RepID=A0ABW4RFK7_9BACL
MFKHKRTKAKQLQFTAQITAESDQIYRLAYCYVKNEQEALDIVSEATYKGCIAFMKANVVTSFELWMLGIVINKAIDHMYRKEPMLFLDDFMQGGESPVVNGSIEEKMNLYKALDQLRPGEKAYIILKYFIGLSFIEMTEVLSVPEHIVESRFYRIMEQISVHLIDGEVESI